MALINTILSYTIQDADGERQAFPYYAQIDDTTTLAGLQVFLDEYGTLLDAIIDGAIKKERIVLDFPLTDGVKADPVAGSEIEKTGLLSYPLISVPGKTFSQDIPAFKVSLFVGNKINLSDTDVVAWTGASKSTGDLPETNDTWGSELQTVRLGQKTFRKHRRQTKRT